MAERQVQPHEIQQQQDETEVKWLFVNLVGRLAERDMDLSQEESTNLSSSVQEAQRQIQLDREDREVCDNIVVELQHLIEQVDGVFDRYSPQLEKVFEHKEPEARSQVFLQVAEGLFRKGITTLRIFVLLRFSYKLVQHFFLEGKNKMEQHLGTEVTDFILLVGAFLFKAFLKCRILPWLQKNGGWKILLPSFNWGGLAVCAGLFLIVVGGWKMYMSPSR